MKLTTYKKVKLVLKISGIPSSLATIYQTVDWIYQKAGKEMLPWVFIAIIAIGSIVVYIYVDYKERKEAELIEREKLNKIIDWLTSSVLTKTYTNGPFKEQPTLEQKINLMISKEFERRSKK